MEKEFLTKGRILTIEPERGVISIEEEGRDALSIFKADEKLMNEICEKFVSSDMIGLTYVVNGKDKIVKEYGFVIDEERERERYGK